MGFLQDLTNKAKNIASKGKSVILDQLSSETIYERDATGNFQMTSTTGNKPKIVGTAKEFLIPSRGYTDEQIVTARPTKKETVVGVAKVAGEIVQGGLTLTSMLGNKIADTVLPGYDAEASAASRNKINEKVSAKLTPKSAGEAKVMRGVDILGFAAAPTKVTKLTKVDDLIKASNKTDAFKALKANGFTDDAIRTNKLDKKIANASDEVAVQKVLKDVMPPVKTANLDMVPKQALATPAKSTKQFDIPKKPTGDTGPFERSYSKRAAEMMPENKEIGSTYEARRSTDELAQKAQNLLKDEPATAKLILQDIIDGADNIGENHIAVASERLNEISRQLENIPDGGLKDDLYAESAELANATAKRLTQLGRDVQAASILNKLTPAGMVKFAAKEVQRFNYKNPFNKIPEITEKEAKEIIDEMIRIQKMPDGTEKKIALFKLQEKNSKRIPSSKIALVQNFWKAGLLTGIKTSGLNVASNTAHFVMERVKEIPASAVDIVTSTFTGKRTNVLTTKGFSNGAKEGWKKGLQYLKTGYDERNIADKLDYHRLNFGKTKMGKVAQTYTDTVFRFIGSQDQPFYYSTLEISLNSQAMATAKNAGLKGKELVTQANKLVANPTDDMLKYALIDATTVVFQNKTLLGKQAKKLQEVAGVGQFIVPFAQTPSSVAMQIINYSPVGIVKTIIENAGKGKFDQRLFSQGIGRGIVGTAPLAIGAALYENGLISLDYPAGNERQIELDKAEGRTYNAIKVGDEWQSAMTLGPAGNLLLIGAYFQKSLEETGSPTEAMVNAGLGAMDSFLEQTFVKGIGQFVDAIQEPKKFASTYLPNLAASFVPTLVADSAKAMDDQERNSTSQSFWGNFVTKPQARIPGLRNELPPQVTTLGQEVPLGEGAVRTAIDPRRPSDDRSTALTSELRRLTEAGFAVSPTKVGDKLGYDALSEDENAEMWKVVGSYVEKSLTKLTEHPKYTELSDDKKADKVKEFTSRAQNEGRALYALTQTEGLGPEEEKKKLKEYKDSGLLTQEVFRLYMKRRNGE